MLDPSNGGGTFMFVKNGGQTIFCPLWMGYLDWEQREDEPTVTDVPQDAKDLVASMLQVDAKQRPNNAVVCKRLERVVMMHELQEAIDKKKQEMEDILTDLRQDMHDFATKIRFLESWSASGLKWQQIGNTAPPQGKDSKELTSSELSAALQKKLSAALESKTELSQTEFTQQEWDGFGIKEELSIDRFVSVKTYCEAQGGQIESAYSYWRPIPTTASIYPEAEEGKRFSREISDIFHWAQVSPFCL